MMSKQRVQSLDVARGIAIICIILGHLGIEQINRFVFSFHVPIFFLISGSFISTKNSFRAFSARRLRTLIVPYISTCIAIIFLAAVKELRHFDSLANLRKEIFSWIIASLYGAGDTWHQPFEMRPIGAIWFLWAMFWSSLLVRLILKLKPEFRPFTVLALFLVGYLSRMWFWFPLSIQAGCCCASFIYIGYLLRQASSVIQRFSREVEISITVFAGIAWICFIRDFDTFWLVHGDIGRGIVDIFGSLCGCYIVFCVSCLLAKYATRISGLLAFLGQYSIFMLCAHIIELNLFPWWYWAGKLLSFVKLPLLPVIRQCIVIAGKLIWSGLLTFVGSKWNYARRMFGFPQLDKE